MWLAEPMFRPYRASNSPFGVISPGVALGFCVAPLRGTGAEDQNTQLRAGIFVASNGAAYRNQRHPSERAIHLTFTGGHAPGHGVLVIVHGALDRVQQHEGRTAPAAPEPPAAPNIFAPQTRVGNPREAPEQYQAADEVHGLRFQPAPAMPIPVFAYAPVRVQPSADKEI